MKRLAQWIAVILVGSAVTPLVIVSYGPFSPVFTKMIFFRSVMGIVGILAACYAGIMIRHVRKVSWNIVRNPLVLVMALFIGSAGISTVFSSNAYRSFFGDGIRAEGFYTLLMCFIFFIAAILFFTELDWSRYVRAVLCVGIVVITVFFFQYSGWGGSLVFPSGSPKQPGSFMGNPALLAGFLILLEGYVILGYRDASRFWKYGALVVGCLAGVALVLLEVRGALAGILAATLFLVFLYAMRMIRLWRRMDNVSPGVPALIIMATLFFIAFAAMIWGTRTHTMWQSVPAVRRLVGFSWESASVKTRFLAWKASSDAFKERPIFGWGLEQYGTAYNKHYNPAYAVHAEDWFDRAHNKILDVLVMQGVIGVASYGMIFFALFYVLGGIQERDSVRYGLGAVMIAYIVQNLFLFDHLDSYILFFGLLAFLAAWYERSAVRSPRAFAVSNYARGGAGISLALLVGVGCYALYAWNGIPLLQAWRYEWATARAWSSRELVVYAERFLRPYNFFQKELRAQFLESALATREEHGATLKALIMKAAQEFEEVVQKESDDPRPFLRIAEAYNQIGQGDHELLQKSIGYIEQARVRSPRRQAILGLQVFTLGSLGKHPEAIQLARDVLALEPKSAKSHYYLGMALASFVRDAGGIPAEDKKRITTEAFQELAIARALGVEDNFGLFSESDFRNMMILYQQGGNDEDFLATYRIAERLFPRNIDYYGIRLGAALARRDIPEIIVIAERIKELDPRYTDDMDIIIDLAKKQKWNILDNL